MSTTLKIATFALLTIATCAVSNSTTISPPEVIDAKLLEDIMADVNGHKVMLYSKTYCPYSKRLKKVLSKYDIDDMKVMELDMDDNMRNLQNTLKTISGRTTVPQLFIGGHFVGGHDESVQLDNKGELKEMLDKAHALQTNRVPVNRNELVATSFEALRSNSYHSTTLFIYPLCAVILLLLFV